MKALLTAVFVLMTCNFANAAKAMLYKELAETTAQSLFGDMGDQVTSQGSQMENEEDGSYSEVWEVTLSSATVGAAKFEVTIKQKLISDKGEEVGHISVRYLGSVPKN